MQNNQLTSEQIRILELPFAPQDHRFTPNGNVYIAKHAIRRRLNMVDPAWQLGRPALVSQSERVIVLSGSLIICGVTRHNVGAGVIQETKLDKETGEVKFYVQAQNEMRAYKTAASDLLPRCAQEFGVGAYLKAEAVKNLRDTNSLERWLKTLPAPPNGRVPQPEEAAV